MTTYRRTQFSWVLIGIFGTIAAVLFATGLGANVAAFWIVGGLVVLVYGVLTITLDDTALTIRFGPGIRHRRVPLAAIRSWRHVRNPWYYGWGVRFYPGGVLYNASGFDAVEIHLDNGTQLRVGTAEPEALMAALRARRGEPDPMPPGGLPAAGHRPRRWLPVVLVFNLVIMAIVVGSIVVQRRPPAIAVTPEAFSVSSGVYGVTVPIPAITGVSLESSLPPIRRRTNGFALGSTRRGHFLVEELGRGQLFTQGDPPYVLIRTADTFVIVNTEDEARTRQVYADLTAAGAPARGL